MTKVRPVLQATINGRTAMIVTPAGVTEQLSAGAGQDVRNVVVSRAYREAIALGTPVEILTAGDRGEFHLVIDGRGALAKVEFGAEPAPSTSVPAPTDLGGGDDTQLQAVAAAERRPQPATIEDDMDRTVLRRRALGVRLEGTSSAPIVGAATVGRRTRVPATDGTVGIDDPTGTVSRRHAVFETTSEEVWITDLGSVNGTGVWSEGRETVLSAGVAHLLNDGDRLRLGDLWLVVRVEEVTA